MNAVRNIAFSLGLLLIAPAARGDYLAYVVESNGNFDRLDITTGQSSLIRSNGSTYAGLAFGPGDELFGITNGLSGRSDLLEVDPATGKATLIGHTGINLTTLASLSDGRFFGVDTQDDLYSINAATGAATRIGPTGLPSLFNFSNSLASDGTHLYYTLSLLGGTSSLYSLDTHTGAASLVGNTGVGGIVGSAYSGPSYPEAKLFGFLTNGATYSIDLATGHATFFGPTGIGDFFGGVGIGPPAVPEPSSLALLAVGAAGLGLYSRRKRRA